jgi:hypothetical protein
MRPQITRSELAARVDDVIAVCAAEHGNLAVKNGRQAVDEGVDALIERGVLVAERQKLRVRDRVVLRYYARTIEHLTAGKARTTH